MAQCEVCGNSYDKTFEVVLADEHVFEHCANEAGAGAALDRI